MKVFKKGIVGFKKNKVIVFNDRDDYLKEMEDKKKVPAAPNKMQDNTQKAAPAPPPSGTPGPR